MIQEPVMRKEKRCPSRLSTSQVFKQSSVIILAVDPITCCLPAGHREPHRSDHGELWSDSMSTDKE